MAIAPSTVQAPEGDEPAHVSALVLTMTVRLFRHPRGKCSHCGLRRILYSLILEGEAEQLGPGAESPRYCAVDAGIIR